MQIVNRQPPIRYMHTRKHPKRWYMRRWWCTYDKWNVIFLERGWKWNICRWNENYIVIILYVSATQSSNVVHAKWNHGIYNLSQNYCSHDQNYFWVWCWSKCHSVKCVKIIMFSLQSTLPPPPPNSLETHPKYNHNDECYWHSSCHIA